MYNTRDTTNEPHIPYVEISIYIYLYIYIANHWLALDNTECNGICVDRVVIIIGT